MTDIRRALFGGRSSIGRRNGGRTRLSEGGVSSPPSPRSAPPALTDPTIEGGTTATGTAHDTSTSASAVADLDDRIPIKIKNKRYVLYFISVHLIF